MSVYQLTLVWDNSNTEVIQCSEDNFILDATDDLGISLPYSCRAGACSTCVGRLEFGIIDQSDQSFLDEYQINAGFILTCVSYPKSDAKILVDQEDVLY